MECEGCRINRERQPAPSTAGERAEVDRSDAVNLARNITDGSGVTPTGVLVLADAVMAMDALLQSPALPVGELMGPSGDKLSDFIADQW
jgi:hypothetical protein